MKRILITSKLQERDHYFTSSLRLVMGNGLLTNKKETWQRHRKLIEPAFHFEALEKYLHTFNEGGLLLCEDLTATRGTEVDVYPVICLRTLRALMSTVFGVELDRVEPDPCKQMKLVADIIKFLKTVTAVLFRPWKAISSVWWMTQEGRELRRLAKMCGNLTQKVLSLLGEDVASTKAKAAAYLAHLYSQEYPAKMVFEDFIRDETLTLAVGGSETTAGALAYTLCLLGLHPEWQEAAHQQMEEVFGTGDDFLRPATAADLSQLTVIDAIIKESLRLFPTVPITPRTIGEDIPLAGGRYVAPRGSCVFVAFWLMHRHPKLFPDPYKFDPGRFFPGGSATSRRSSSYLPFSTGSRRCLGGQFAIMEMKILLATVLRRLRIIPGSSREELETTVFSITSHPLTGYRLSCVPWEISSVN